MWILDGGAELIVKLMGMGTESARNICSFNYYFKNLEARNFKETFQIFLSLILAKTSLTEYFTRNEWNVNLI